MRPCHEEPYAFAPRRDALLAHVRPGMRVLDLGCGGGAFSAVLVEAGAEVVAVDVAAGALLQARERVPGLRAHLVAPGEALPLADTSVDLVWAGEVIEHVADTARWLSEVRRVLRTGGLLVLSTPYHGRVKNLAIALVAFERHYDPRGQHLRFFTKRSLRALLGDFGFEDVRVRTLGGPPLLRSTMIAAARRAGWVAAR